MNSHQIIIFLSALCAEQLYVYHQLGCSWQPQAVSTVLSSPSGMNKLSCLVRKFCLEWSCPHPVSSSQLRALCSVTGQFEDVGVVGIHSGSKHTGLVSYSLQGQDCWEKD